MTLEVVVELVADDVAYEGIGSARRGPLNAPSHRSSPWSDEICTPSSLSDESEGLDAARAAAAAKGTSEAKRGGRVFMASERA